MADTDSRDYVAEATAQGWKEDFEGPNKTDAKTFVEKGEQIAALAITQRDATKVENAQLSSRIRLIPLYIIILPHPSIVGR